MIVGSSEYCAKFSNCHLEAILNAHIALMVNSDPSNRRNSHNGPITVFNWSATGHAVKRFVINRAHRIDREAQVAQRLLVLNSDLTDAVRSKFAPANTRESSDLDSTDRKSDTTIKARLGFRGYTGLSMAEDLCTQKREAGLIARPRCLSVGPELFGLL